MVAFGLSAVFLVAEVVAAILTDSLALWAGAGHMLADVVAVIGTQDIVFGEIDR